MAGYLLNEPSANVGMPSGVVPDPGVSERASKVPRRIREQTKPFRLDLTVLKTTSGGTVIVLSEKCPTLVRVFVRVRTLRV